MDALRKRLGELVRTAREAQGYRSQPAFADAARVSARIISDVERGQKVGRKSLEAIERTLRWTKGSTTTYLEGGSEPAAAPPSTETTHEWSADSRARILAMSGQEIIAQGRSFLTTSGTRAAMLWLTEAARIKAEAEAIPAANDAPTTDR